jgi:hypothetical protein
MRSVHRLIFAIATLADAGCGGSVAGKGAQPSGEPGEAGVSASGGSTASTTTTISRTTTFSTMTTFSTTITFSTTNVGTRSTSTAYTLTQPGSSVSSSSTGGGGACSCASPPALDIVYLGGLSAGICPAGFTYNSVNNDWFHYSDGTSSAPYAAGQVPGGCDNASACAYHTSGMGFTGYGAGAGITLNANTVFNASPYTGLSVWMRGKTTGTRGPGMLPLDNTVHVKFVTAAAGGTDPRQGDDYGGFCPLGTDPSCYTVCRLPFSSLAREGIKSVDAGAPDPATDEFDPQNLVKIQFEFSAYMAPGSSVAAVPVSYDVWIDMIAWMQ